MPEFAVKISDSANRTAAVSSDGRFLTSITPESYQFYFHTIYDVPGVVAANNFMSIFNPVGSGKTIAFYQAEISSYATGASGTNTSMVATRISAASGGTQITAANINRFLTTWSNPVTEVRVGNPTTTTVGTPLNAWVPPLANGAGVGATAYTSTPPGEGFVCLPGQGISFSTAAGNVNQAWKINVIWAEF